MCICIFISHSHIVDIRNSTNKFFTFLFESLSVALKTSQKKSCSDIAFTIGRRDRASIVRRKKRVERRKCLFYCSRELSQQIQSWWRCRRALMCTRTTTRCCCLHDCSYPCAFFIFSLLLRENSTYANLLFNVIHMVFVCVLFCVGANLVFSLSCATLQILYSSTKI